MRLMHVTCPESAHLETLEVEHHPLGMLVGACTRDPDGEPACGRRCAALLDQKERSRRTAHTRLESEDAALASLEVGDQTRYGLDDEAPLDGSRGL